MSSDQTNQVDPGDSATDLSSTIQDETNEHAHTGFTGQTGSAPTDTDNPLFPGQTADEQNLEVDVCCPVRSSGGFVLARAEKRLTVHS